MGAKLGCRDGVEMGAVMKPSWVQGWSWDGCRYGCRDNASLWVGLRCKDGYRDGAGMGMGVTPNWVQGPDAWVDAGMSTRMVQGWVWG